MSQTTVNGPEPAREIHKWNLIHGLSIARQQAKASNEQAHGNAVRPAPSPPSSPSTAASWANFPLGTLKLKTPASQPSAHYYLSLPPTHLRLQLDEDTTITMPNSLYLTPGAITVGRGRGCPLHRRRKLKLRPRPIGRASPHSYKMRHGE